MGWLASEGTVVVVAGFVVLLALSPPVRARTRRGTGRVGAAAMAALRAAGVLPRATTRPDHRPIEVVAREARRIGRLYRATRSGVSFAKSEAVRRAYDGVLAEGCAALDLPHLLGLLGDGEELDAERFRVERLLHLWGIDLDDAA